MATNFTDTAWLQSTVPCEVSANSAEVASKIWFKSKPVDRDFCYRVTQIQLTTDSRDQVFVTDKKAGSWTWFELAILPDEVSNEPKKSKDGKDLVWRSHSNRLAGDTDTCIRPEDMERFTTRHFGAVFDRRSDLLANFEVGDVLAVRVCARFQDWTNFAKNGFIVARVLNEDLFTPHRWTLSTDIIPALSDNILDGSYSIMSNGSCFLKANGNELNSKIWFTTAALDADAIKRLESIQLFTSSRFQESQKEPVASGDSFSWFDLVILETPFSTTPKVTNGVSLVWQSHSNDSAFTHSFGIQGQLFDIDVGDDEIPRSQQIVQIKGSLEPGNAIGVRVCAQYPGWENYAESGQLVVRISNEDRATPVLEVPDMTAADEGFNQLEKAMKVFYKEIGYTSATTAALSNEARADLVFSAPPPRPLRLLSLDGGGVRGVSSLRILKKIMQDVARREGKDTVKPCEYFDMMAGTSTGGLIALMLGRLRMSIEECEAAYDDISKKVFATKAGWISKGEDTAFLLGSYMYEAGPLEEAIKAIVKHQLHDANAPMREDEPVCKVLLMSALASAVEDGNTGVHLRSYGIGPTVPEEYPGWTIWEAARATSAAPVYFKRFEKDGKEFVDGGLGWNNPTYELIAELPTLYGKSLSIDCIVSIGTGIPPHMKLGSGIKSVRDFIAIATNSEVPHNQVKRSSSLLPQQDEDKYWRFNMSKAMSQQDWVEEIVKTWLGPKTEKLTYDQIMVKMDDYTAIDMIRVLTDKWLEHDDTKKLVDECASKIVGTGKV